MTAIGADLARAYPDTNKNRRWDVRTELQARIAQSPPDAMLVAMLATLAIAVLLVACANVAGLLASRAPVRAREMAMRLAIGAGRRRLVRQLVTESLLTSLRGARLGLGVGYAGMPLFRQVELPTDLPILLAFRMDHRALLVSLVVSVASSVLSGLLPAIQASRADLTAVMKAGDAASPGAGGAGGGPCWWAARSPSRWCCWPSRCSCIAVSAAQLAGGPGLSHRPPADDDVRHEPRPVYRGAVGEFFKEVADRAREVPGVVRVAMAASAPMANRRGGRRGARAGGVPVSGREGGRRDPGGPHGRALLRHHGPHDPARPRVHRRRTRPARRTVAIVNEVFARHYWPDAGPDRQALPRLGRDGSWVQVVGLAKTSKYLFIAEPPTEYVYLPYRQSRADAMVMLVQSAGDPALSPAPLREVAHRLDPNLPIYNVRTMEEFYRMRATTIFHVIIGAVGGMGLMGLGLAIVGLYGLVAYAVSRRTREIGIRMAIGADRFAVLKLVLRQGLVLAAVGLVLGLAASVGVGRLLAATFPTGMKQDGLAMLLLLVPVVLGVTFLAAYIPARRAARTNPVQALRQE